MNLWQVNDDGDPFDGQWAELIWAWGRDETIEVAKRRYEYPRELERSGKTAEEYFEVRLIDWPGIRQKPERDYPHAEYRYFVMRHAGWMADETDRQCDSCGLYTMLLTTVCDECWCCDECGCDCSDMFFTKTTCFS